MANYYEILGLKSGAEITEIKAAFRHLAKLYHPDINPEGKERFTTILKAYEVLSDPSLKYSYDYKLNNAHSSQQRSETKNKPKDKNWRFDERELKRRQYYNDHIKKYEKKYSSAPEPELKSSYNEFKYILFATPLAVALFLGIMSIASGKKSTEKEKVIATEIKTTSDLKMGDAPYTWYFGSGIYKIENQNKIIFKNLTGADVIVCIFQDSQFIRSFFIESGFSAEVSQLPDEPLSLRYSKGKYFSQSEKVPGTAVSGNFTSDATFYKSNKPVVANSINELTLAPEMTEGFTPIDALEFFKKNND